MLRVNIKRRAMFDVVIDMLYDGWYVEHMTGDWITIRPFRMPAHPYR